jgi:hypothetical protein
MGSKMTPLDQISLALCAWKENRGGGITGMTSVINVVMNRCADSGASPYAEIYRPLQFSSMSYQHDPQLLIQPKEWDMEWGQALQLAREAADGKLPDITGGANFYYALSIAVRPKWAATKIPTVVIAGQQFLR